MTTYRDGLVFIRGSKHTAPDKEAVKDMMPVLFELLEEETEETEASVRAVLGHFLFVLTHPYRWQRKNWTILNEWNANIRWIFMDSNYCWST